MKKSNLHAIDRGAIAKKGHLTDNKPFQLRRADDEPGRIEEEIRKRTNTGTYARSKKKVEAAPVTLNWVPPKGR